MTEFTKDELLLIQEGISYLCEADIVFKECSEQLPYKIQSMIDNYYPKPKRTLAELHQSEI